MSMQFDGHTLPLAHHPVSKYQNRNSSVHHKLSVRDLVVQWAVLWWRCPSFTWSMILTWGTDWVLDSAARGCCSEMQLKVFTWIAPCVSLQELWSEQENSDSFLMIMSEKWWRSKLRVGVSFSFSFQGQITYCGHWGWNALQQRSCWRPGAEGAVAKRIHRALWRPERLPPIPARLLRKRNPAAQRELTKRGSAHTGK